MWTTITCTTAAVYMHRPTIVASAQSTLDVLSPVRNNTWDVQEVMPSRFTVPSFSLQPRSLTLLLRISKDRVCRSKLVVIHLHRAKLFSYQDRLDYERSPELVHLLTMVLQVLKRVERTIRVEAWAGSEAWMAAAQERSYDWSLLAVVAAPRADKGDYLHRTWYDLGTHGSESMLLDYRNVWGPGNIYLHNPAGGIGIWRLKK